jgi:hypothetical protein
MSDSAREEHATVFETEQVRKMHGIVNVSPPRKTTKSMRPWAVYATASTRFQGSGDQLTRKAGPFPKHQELGHERCASH